MAMPEARKSEDERFIPAKTDPPVLGMAGIFFPLFLSGVAGLAGSSLPANLKLASSGLARSSPAPLRAVTSRT